MGANCFAVLYVKTRDRGILTYCLGVFAFFFLGKLNMPAERMFAAHVVFQISLLSLLLFFLPQPARLVRSTAPGM